MTATPAKPTTMPASNQACSRSPKSGTASSATITGPTWMIIAAVPAST